MRSSMELAQLVTLILNYVKLANTQSEISTAGDHSVWISHWTCYKGHLEGFATDVTKPSKTLERVWIEVSLDIPKTSIFEHLLCVLKSVLIWAFEPHEHVVRAWISGESAQAEPWAIVCDPCSLWSTDNPRLRLSRSEPLGRINPCSCGSNAHMSAEL